MGGGREGRARAWLRWGVALVAGLLNGLLGAGATLLVPGLAYGVGLERRRAHGTALPLILEASALSAAIYLWRGQFPGSFVWWVAAGGAAGGLAGAFLTGRLSSRGLRYLFGLAMLVAAWRMVAG